MTSYLEFQLLRNRRNERSDGLCSSVSMKSYCTMEGVWPIPPEESLQFGEGSAMGFDGNSGPGRRASGRPHTGPVVRDRWRSRLRQDHVSAAISSGRGEPVSSPKRPRNFTKSQRRMDRRSQGSVSWSWTLLPAAAGRLRIHRLSSSGYRALARRRALLSIGFRRRRSFRQVNHPYAEECPC